MPEDKMQEKVQSGIERFVLLFYLICSVIMAVIVIRSAWPIWPVLLTGMCWASALILYCTKVRTYKFRAYAVTCLMKLCVVIWSIYTHSLTLTVPVLSMGAVVLVLYGIPELIYISAFTSAFLILYHFLIQHTVDFSSSAEVLQAVLQIISLFIIESISYILNRKRLEGLEKQTQIINSLKEAERSKDDFMANVSHEIRTPINTICGMSEIILREELPDQVRTDVFSIQTAGRSLQSIVSDVLDFTEMQSGEMTLVEEAYNITSTINDVINMSLARKNEKLIDLIVDCDANLPSSLIGDEQKIRRIIMNLVNNALKFTTEGCVSIIIGARKTDYGINLGVRVKDTGIGMKKESLEKLFTTFNQVDTKRNRQEEGIGLGLAISQALVSMMGGFITASSEYGKGSEIQFVIPQKVSNPEPIAAVHDKDSVNVAIYVDMERYDLPEVREAYGQVITHMITQLKVKCHICQNLPELKRRIERETFTHIFVSIEEYEEDSAYFDRLSENTKIIVVIERFNEKRITNPRIQRLYKPFFILPIVRTLNDEKLMQSIDTGYYFEGRFIAPDANLLVVDDNLMNIRVMEGLLHPYQIKVSIATSGAEALDKIDNMDYDVIFMDHMMPEMDGIETLHRIRQKQGNYYKKIPVVAVTANAVGGMREVFLREGFQDFIAKPIEVSVLERVLKRILPQEKLHTVETDFEKGNKEMHPTVPGKQQEVQNDERMQNGPETHSEPEISESSSRCTDLPADIFNEQMGITYCGSIENYLEILRLISDNGKDDCAKIEQCYVNQNWRTYTTLVHALKSTMRSVGVEKLAEMAKALELSGKHGEESYIIEHHEEMMLEYSMILALLKKSRILYPQEEHKVPEENGQKALTDAELDKLALEFEDAAFAFDQGKMNAIAEYLSSCSYSGHAMEEAMKPILHKIQMSDYLSASEAVARLKEKLAEASL